MEQVDRMSGIYIHGMVMPKGNVPVKAFIYPDGSVRVKLQGGGYLGLHATPVPDHGRLIDADALPDFPFYTNITIKSAPTIIPADTEG